MENFPIDSQHPLGDSSDPNPYLSPQSESWSAAPQGYFHTPPTSPLAVVSLCLGIASVVIGIPLSCCCSFIGWIITIPLGGAAIACGAAALPGINRGEQQGQGMAIAGMVLGGLGLLVPIILALLFFAGMLGGAFQQMPQGGG